MNTTYTPSEHAQVRSQQRAIPSLDIELIMLYGEEFYSGGRTVMAMNARALKKLRRDLEKTLKRLESLGNEYVVTEDDRIVTVGHRTRRRF